MSKNLGLCEDCGQKDWLSIHHKDRNHLNNEVENLRFLCSHCHGKEHGPEAQDERTIPLRDTFDLIGYHRIGNRLKEGFSLLNEYK